jgi:hypothetical protein
MQRPFSVIALIVLVSGIVRAQLRDTEPGIWVVYGGKDQFRLAEARRIPAGEMVSIRGYPLPAQLPEVWLRDPESGKREVLEIIAEPANNSWTANVPALKPNTRTEIIVGQYLPLTAPEKEKVERTLEEMLLVFFDGWNAGHIPPEEDAAKMGQAIEEHLAASFPPDQTLAEYVRVENGKPQSGTLGGELIRLIGTQGANDLTLRNFVSEQLQALRNLNTNLVGKHLASASLPPTAKKRLEDSWKQFPAVLFAKPVEAMVWMKEVLRQRPALLPISGETAAALGDLIVVANADTNLREDVKTLQTPLKEKFPQLFSSLRRLEATTYSTQTIAFPFLSADLLRYGTVDFVQGYVTGIKEARGFLLFSFFPTGPQERTPNGVVAGRVAAAIGYSVTGGEENGEAFYLVGLCWRNNRYVSMTAGGVVRTKGGGPWFGFFGVAADLTAIPFLKDLFTVRQ